MFGANFQRKYALTDQGVQNTKKGTFWTVVVNLVVMGGVSILYLVMSGLMASLTNGASLPPFLPVLAGLVVFALLSFLTHLQQYKATYGPVSYTHLFRESPLHNQKTSARIHFPQAVLLP